MVALGLAGISAHAALIAYEGFDYPDGSDLADKNGGTGWTTPWGVNSSGVTVAGNSPGDTNILGSFSYVDAAGNTLNTTGNRGFFTGAGGTSQPFRDFATTGAGRGVDGSTTWISVMIIRTGPVLDNPTNIYLRGANISFFDGNTERFGIGNPSSAPDNFLCLIQGGTVSNRRATSTPYNQLSFAVLRIDHLAGNDNAYLFVNPNLGVEPDISAANAQTIGLFNYTFNRARPFAGNTDQSGARPYAEITLDELRIGESYADVTPHTPGVTPGVDITWVGGVNGDWDKTTANWRTNGGPATVFVDGDFVHFDDTATGETNVNLTTTLRPSSVTVSNETLTYKFTGSGQLAVIGGLTKSGAGLLTIDNSGANSVAAGVFIEAGTLQIGSGGTNGSLGSGNITNDASLIVNRSGSLVMNNAISGTGSLTKNGDGSLALGGSLSYAGTTTVNGGTLLLNGTLSGGGAITTTAGTTLGGNGTSSGAVNASGLIYPGNASAAGTLTLGPVSLAAGATLKFDLSNNNTPGGAFNDLLQVIGDLTALDNTIIVNFIGYPQTDVPYRLINYTGLLVGTFNPVIVGTHYVAVLDQSTPGQINVTFSGTGASLKWNSTSSSVWDLGTTANWLNLTTSLPDVFYAGDTVLFDDSVAGVQTSVTLAAGVSAAPTAVTVNAAQHFTFSGAGRITGPATILKQGTGTLTLSNASDFTGAVTIEGGTARAGSGTAFGAGAAGITIADGATLDINGQNLTAEAVTVTGAGVDGKGAIVNNGPEQQSALRTLTLAGDTTLGGTGRWDMRNTGGTASLRTSGSAYNLAKVGTNQVSLVAVTEIDTLVGDIDIREGSFAIQTTTVQVGDALGVITVHPGATLGVWNLNAVPLNKLLSFHDGATLLNENGRSIIQGSGNLLGMLTINSANAGTSPSLTLNSSFDGSGGITKIGAGPLIINGLHFYGGPTVVSNGTLFVDGQLPVSSSLTVYGGGTLAGVGQVSAPIAIAANGTVAPGNATTAIATLTAESSLSLTGTNVMDVNKAGTTITSDSISGLTSLIYGGTLRLTLTGAALAGGDIISLYGFASASGAFTTIIPATPGPGLQWDTSQLTVNGTLRVGPPPRPRASSTSVAGGNLTISGTNGPANWSYRVLTSTDVALPVASWVPFQTNVFGPDGSFTFSAPIEPGTAQRFFILVLP